jgi:hypothetical protein
MSSRRWCSGGSVMGKTGRAPECRPLEQRRTSAGKTCSTGFENPTLFSAKMGAVAAV